MTQDEILSLPAGEELDALASEVVLGDSAVGPFSRSRRFAMELLDALPEDEDGRNRWYWRIECRPLRYDVVVWWCGGNKWQQPALGVEAGVCAVTLEEALTKACVIAVMKYRRAMEEDWHLV